MEKWVFVPKYVKERMAEVKDKTGRSLNQQAGFYIAQILEDSGLNVADIPVMDEEERVHLYEIDMEKVEEIQRRGAGLSAAGAIRLALIHGVNTNEMLLKEEDENS